MSEVGKITKEQQADLDLYMAIRKTEKQDKALEKSIDEFCINLEREMKAHSRRMGDRNYYRPVLYTD